MLGGTAALQARTPMSTNLHELVGKGIFKSCIRLDTTLRLYQTYVVPVVMYGCETWTTTQFLCARSDALDMWALRKILRIPFIRHVSNSEVPDINNSGPLSYMVTDRILRFYGYIAHSSPFKTITGESQRQSGRRHQTGDDQ